MKTPRIAAALLLAMVCGSAAAKDISRCLDFPRNDQVARCANKWAPRTLPRATPAAEAPAPEAPQEVTKAPPAPAAPTQEPTWDPPFADEAAKQAFLDNLDSIFKLRR